MNRLLLLPLLAAASLAHASEHEQAAPRAPADPAKGQAIVATVCVACHGVDGNSPAPTNPKLAGQHADYLYVALRAYQKSTQPTLGRANAIMVGQAAQFKPAELKAIANYLGSLPGDVKTVPQSRFR
jgi:cytochrome c553